MYTGTCLYIMSLNRGSGQFHRYVPSLRSIFTTELSRAQALLKRPGNRANALLAYSNMYIYVFHILYVSLFMPETVACKHFQTPPCTHGQIQWNPSIQDTLKKRHLNAQDTLPYPINIYLFLYIILTTEIRIPPHFPVTKHPVSVVRK